ncbi:efflux RND transporter permease subunit [Wukongibacter baidiensis]|uniref:efflux RND transporter permease subunit n=1 Tax=Wukongibacter baidiensis TaxID=1723361 RepID=UPI003D7F9C0F
MSRNNKKNIPELEAPLNFLGKWSSWFVSRYRVTYLIMGAILIWGVAGFLTLPVESNPEVKVPIVQITTLYVGASPTEVENLITDKIEEELENIKNVKKINSSSSLGYSLVTVEFESKVDIDDKTREVKDKINGIREELPDDAEEPSIISIKTGDSPVMVLSVSGPFDEQILEGYAKEIKEDLKSIDGISEIDILGGREREIQIILDPEKLAAYGVSLYEVKEAVASENISFPGGNMDFDDKSYNIRTMGRYEDVESIGYTIIRSSDEGDLLLRDVSEIIDGFEAREMYIRKAFKKNNDYSTENSVVISIKKKNSAHIVKLCNKIEKRLKGYDYERSGISVDVSSNMAEFVDDQVGLVFSSAVSGFFLVIIVLFLFIGFNEALIVSIVIPLAIFATLGLFKVVDFSINNITIFSILLAVGMLVDNGIVIMENIVRLKEKGISSKESSIAATNQVAPAVMSSTLTTIAAFAPLALVNGMMGDFIRPTPITVILALSASFFIAITINPAISSIFLKDRKKYKENKILSRIFNDKTKKYLSIIFIFVLSVLAFKNDDLEGIRQYGLLSFIAAIGFSYAMYRKQFKSRERLSQKLINKYSHFLTWIMESKQRKKRLIIYMVIAFLISLSLVGVGLLKVEMTREIDMKLMYIDIETPSSQSLEDTLKVSMRVEDQIKGLKELDDYITYVGGSGVDIWQPYNSETVANKNQARIALRFIPKTHRDRTSMEIAEYLRKTINGIPGAKITITEIEDAPPVGAPVDIRIIGKDINKTRKIANDFKKMLKDINGTEDVETSLGTGASQLVVKVDKDKASRLGLRTRDIAYSIRYYSADMDVTKYMDDGEEFDVVIKKTDGSLNNIKDMKSIYFLNSKGEAIPFSEIATLREVEGIKSIEHEDSKRFVKVYSNLKEGYVGAEILNTFEEKIKDYDIPSGIDIKFGGEAEALNETFTEMMINMVIAVILVYTILVVQFNSLIQPMIILLTVPMALIGVMPGLFITGNNFDFFAFVGLVSLVGIAVNDAIVLIDYINYLRNHGHSLEDAIITTGKTRFMPVMATTLTTIGGILPITINRPFFQSMGVAIISGLMMATILTLVIVPVVYSMFEDRISKVKGIS